MSMRHFSNRLDSKQFAKIAVFEKRLLMACTVSVVFGLLLWVISIATDYWFTVSCPRGAFVNRTGLLGLDVGYLTSSHAGLWRTCKTFYSNGSLLPAGAAAAEAALGPAAAEPAAEAAVETARGNDSVAALGGVEAEPIGNRTRRAASAASGETITDCHYRRVKFIPDLDEEDPLNVVIAYRRTCLGFSVISLLMLALSIFFSIYTFRVRRYTFKRVAACLHFIVAAVQLVVVEVEVTSLHYQELRVFSTFPPSCTWDYSGSFVLGWICFIINLAAGIGFIYASGKKKKQVEGNAAEGQEEDGDDFDDEPQIMGR